MGTDGVKKATHKPFNHLAVKKMIAGIKRQVADMQNELKFKPLSSSEIMGDLSFKADSTTQYAAGKASGQDVQIVERNSTDSSAQNAAKKVLPNVPQIIVVAKNPHK